MKAVQLKISLARFYFIECRTIRWRTVGYLKKTRIVEIYIFKLYPTEWPCKALSCKAEKRQTWLKYKPKFYDIFLGTTCLPSQGGKRFFAFRPSTKRSTTRNRSCFCYYVTSTPAIFFNFQVKRDGRESNRATNLSPPPRLKMTDINRQTTKKSKVYVILTPPPPPPAPNEKI